MTGTYIVEEVAPELLDRALALLGAWLPAALTLVLGAIGLVLLNRWLTSRTLRREAGRVAQQLSLFALSAVLVVVFVLALPIGGQQKGQLLSLLGLLFSAAIALSSTTFLGNAIAGLMIRAVEDFRPGDFIRVNDHFGRVSERGLLHVEIQTDARDLVTVPNLQIVSNPVQVVRASGTIVSADVSLGYDLDRARVERLLLEAAEAAGLGDGFVRVMALGDFSVSYRVSGLLADLKTLVMAKSRLYGEVLDALHGDGVEIVSPTFMNQRPQAAGERFVADPRDRREERRRGPRVEVTPDAIVFDKADRAAAREELQTMLEQDREERAAKASQQTDEQEVEARQRLAREIEALDRRIERITEFLARDPEEDD